MSTTRISRSTCVCSLILDQLCKLPFDAFTKVIALLLEKLGYQDIQPVGRTDWKGHNRAGGVDLKASYQSATGRRSIAFQLKQFRPTQRLFQRAVDELRGVCLRQGTSEGMLITTSGYSPSITGIHAPIAPIYLMGGQELALLLHQYHIGVSREGKLDEDFFKRLERESRGNRPKVSTRERSGKAKDILGDDLVVTVSLRQKRASLRPKITSEQDLSEQPF